MQRAPLIGAMDPQSRRLRLLETKRLTGSAIEASVAQHAASPRLATHAAHGRGSIRWRSVCTTPRAVRNNGSPIDSCAARGSEAEGKKSLSSMRPSAPARGQLICAPCQREARLAWGCIDPSASGAACIAPGPMSSSCLAMPISLAFWLHATDSENCCAFRGRPNGQPLFRRRIHRREEGNDLIRAAAELGAVPGWEQGRFTDLWLRYFPVSPF